MDFFRWPPSQPPVRTKPDVTAVSIPVKSDTNVFSTTVMPQKEGLTRPSAARPRRHTRIASVASSQTVATGGQKRVMTASVEAQQGRLSWSAVGVWRSGLKNETQWGGKA